MRCVIGREETKVPRSCSRFIANERTNLYIVERGSREKKGKEKKEIPQHLIRTRTHTCDARYAGGKRKSSEATGGAEKRSLYATGWEEEETDRDKETGEEREKGSERVKRSRERSDERGGEREKGGRQRRDGRLGKDRERETE